jgi:tRNA threonylcarbamoyladenosine biosynthesis protein TsaB
MNILAIDTSTYVMGVAILQDNKIIGEYITNTKKNHSVRLMPAIERLMSDCGITPNLLDKIVVAKGPGSYTGVRIGVTVAKTLAWSLNIPLVGISSLEQLAWNGKEFKGLICPIMDARRQQLFTGLYQFNKDDMEVVIPDQNILIEEWIIKLKEYETQVLFIGNDLSIHQETIRKGLGEQAIIAPSYDWNPRPSILAYLGLTKESEPTHTLVPSYLRLAEAEANWLASKESSE